MSKLKKLISILLMSIMVSVICGCGFKSPEGVVKSYVDNAKKGNNGQFERLLDVVNGGSRQQGFGLTDDEDKKDNKNDKEEIKKISKIMKDLTYKVNSSEIDDNTATVNLTVNGPDFSGVLQEYMQKSFQDAFSSAFSFGGFGFGDNDDEKKSSDLFLECLDDVQYTERSCAIKLKKGDDGWEIQNEDDLSALIFNCNLPTIDGRNLPNDNGPKGNIPGGNNPKNNTPDGKDSEDKDKKENFNTNDGEMFL